MQFAMILSVAVAEFFPTLANPCTQLTIRFFRNRNEKLKKKEMLPLDFGFKRNGKLNFYSYISLFVFKVTLKIEILISKFDFSETEKRK